MLDKCMKEYSALCKKTGIRKSIFKRNRTLVLVVVFLFITWAGNAINYYVSNSGNDSKEGTTQETAWRTISKVNNTKFAPGDQILFERGGVWREQLKISSSGASGNPIIFDAYGSGNNPVIDGADVITEMTSVGSNIWQKTGITIQPNVMYLNKTVGYPKTSLVACTSKGNWFWDSVSNTFYIYSESDPSGSVELGQRKALINVSNRDNITLSSLTIQHSNEKSVPTDQDFGSGAVLQNGGDNLIIASCTIQKNGFFGVRTVNSSQLTFKNNVFYRNGEGNKNGSNVHISGNNDSDIVFANNISTHSGKDGLMIVGSSKTSDIHNIEIYGNTFNNNNAAGLYLIRTKNATIYNNTFDSNGDAIDTSEDYAIGIQSSDNVDIYENTITNQLHNDAIQIYADADAGSGSAHNVSIYKNSISGVTSGDGIGIGVYGDNTMQNLKIYYNVITGADAYGIYFAQGDALGLDTAHVFNNTIYNNTLAGVGTTIDYPIEMKNNIIVENGEPNVNFYNNNLVFTSNNLYYKASGNVLRHNSNYYTTATITNFEASAQNTDPLFADPANGDFSLQKGSPAINTGADVGLIEDINGNPIVGNPDIGAYESQEKSDEAITKYTTEDISICEGESYEGWTTSGQYERTLTAISGADSIVTTNLTVNLVYYVSEDIHILEGENYNGWTESGEYERTLTSISGCDSIVTTNLTVALNKYTTENIEICEGKSYEGWTISGEYERTLTASSGADSIVTTLLTVHPVQYTAEDMTIYDGESYEGWTESGEYERTLIASTGCDSIVTTNLTVALNKYTTENIEICEGESYEGWTISGEYERTLTALSGADSVVTTWLTVHPIEYTTEDITIYEGESYEGWTESGEYERTLIASTGCDSIVTTNLTVLQTIHTTEAIEICEGESYEGWTVSGEYERTLTALSGADSVVTTWLTVHPIEYITEDITIYEGESYEGWTESGEYERTLIASTGCDSIVTTNLTVLQTIHTTEEIGICEGESYEGWTISGEYERTLTASSGADSVVTTWLTVHPVQYTTENITILEGESYEGWTATGEYQRVLTSVSGCDSIVTTHLTVEPIPEPNEELQTQTIHLEKGWNIFSTYLDPTNAGMESVMEELVNGGDLVIVEDEVLNTYEQVSLKSTGSSWINNIGNVQNTEGYKIQVQSSCVLEITGTPVSLPITIELKRGENLISFPVNGSVDAMQVIQPLIDANVIKKVQDEKGNAIEKWRNLGWINGIGNFHAGEGYVIDAKYDGILTINELTEKSGIFITERPEPDYFKVGYEGNGVDHMNINMVELNATNFRIGDEIAAFDGEICVGAVKLTETDLMNDAVSIPVSAAEPDGKNGFAEGNPIELRVWHINKSAISLSQSAVVEGDLMYQKRASVFVQMTDQTTTGMNDFESIKIDMFPNPARDNVTLRFSTLPERGTRIELTDIAGRQLLVSEVQSTQEVLNIRSQPAGMYLVKTISGDNYTVRKLIIN
jgi:parallel beta-helix repeat protein